MPGSEDRRSQLAKVAYEVVASAGIDKLSLRVVARKVGATTGLLSHHFADRSDLLAAALDFAAAEMIQRIAGVADSTDPLALLAAILPTDPGAQAAWRFSLSVRASGLFQPELRQFDQKVRSYWNENLPKLLKDLPAKARQEAAQHLVVLVEGIALSAVLDPELWPADRQLRHLRVGLDTIGRGAFSDVDATPVVPSR